MYECLNEHCNDEKNFSIIYIFLLKLHIKIKCNKNFAMQKIFSNVKNMYFHLNNALLKNISTTFNYPKLTNYYILYF